MTKINWVVRLKNKNFWVGAIPAVILLVELTFKLFGVEIDLSDKQQILLDMVNQVFILATLYGVVIDPTTKNTGDSIQAQNYIEPK